MAGAITPADGFVPIQFDETGRIGEDLSCIQCMYNLRGMEPHAKCPECGLAVERSMQGDRIRFQNPLWLKRLGQATLWCAVSHFGWLVAWVVYFINIMLLGLFSKARPMPNNPLLYFLPTLLVGAVVYLLNLFAYWRVTLPPVDRYQERSWWNFRVVARYGLTLGRMGWGAAIGIPIAVALLEGASQNSADWDKVMLTVGLAIIFATIVWPIGVVAVLVYLTRLARRIPVAVLAVQLKIIMILFLIGYLLWLGSVVFVSVMSAVSPSNHSGYEIAGVVIGCGSMLWAVGIWTWELVALIWLCVNIRPMAKPLTADRP